LLLWLACPRREPGSTIFILPPPTRRRNARGPPVAQLARIRGCFLWNVACRLCRGAAACFPRRTPQGADPGVVATRRVDQHHRRLQRAPRAFRSLYLAVG